MYRYHLTGVPPDAHTGTHASKSAHTFKSLQLSSQIIHSLTLGFVMIQLKIPTEINKIRYCGGSRMSVYCLIYV
jgi:hypothetical protein